MVVGLRLIELASLTVRLVAFDFAMLALLHNKSVEGASSLIFATSDGFEGERCSSMFFGVEVLSGRDGIETGMGRSIDKRDATSGIGMFSDSLRGLTGLLKAKDP